MTREREPGRAGGPKLSIVMPVWNEGEVIEPTARVLAAVLPFEYEALFVVDEPDDSSVPVAERLSGEIPGVRLVHNRLGRGPANAVRAGVEAARGEYVLIFPADDFGPALAIPGAVSMLESGCDLVSGTRYAHGGKRLGGSFVQGALSRAGNRLFQWLSGSAFSDATTCFKAFRRPLFEAARLESSGWEIMYELSLKAQAADAVLGEMPISSIDRLSGGSSSFALLPGLRRYLHWFVWGLRRMRIPGTGRRIRVHGG